MFCKCQKFHCLVVSHTFWVTESTLQGYTKGASNTLFYWWGGINRHLLVPSVACLECIGGLGGILGEIANWHYTGHYSSFPFWLDSEAPSECTNMSLRIFLKPFLQRQQYTTDINMREKAPDGVCQCQHLYRIESFKNDSLTHSRFVHRCYECHRTTHFNRMSKFRLVSRLTLKNIPAHLQPRIAFQLQLKFICFFNPQWTWCVQGDIPSFSRRPVLCAA